MKTVIVTGGAGFIGSNFVHLSLKMKDLRIVVVDKLTYAGHLDSLTDIIRHPRFHFIKADIADQKRMESLFQRFRPKYIFNFAAETHVDRSIDNPSAFIHSNVVGTFGVLEALRKYLAKPKAGRSLPVRLLHVSTDEVFGSLGSKGRFSEESPYSPRSPYSATKAAADHLVCAYYETYRLPILITNCSNNFGPYQYPEKLIPLTILNALEGKPLPIYGDGKNIRDWLYVEDHCDGLWRVMKRGVLGEKYNIGGHGERRNIDVVTSICQCLEQIRPVSNVSHLRKRGFRRYRDLMTFVPDRPGHDRRYAIDASKIKRELGWRPRWGFEDGLHKTVAWFVNHTDWCQKVQGTYYSRERLGMGK